jgi:hypothetical protein
MFKKYTSLIFMIALLAGCTQIDRTDYKELKSDVRFLIDRNSETMLVSRLMVQLSLLKGERAKLGVRLVENTTKIQGVEAQIDVLAGEIADLKEGFSRSGKDFNKHQIYSYAIDNLSFHISMLKAERAKLKVLFVDNSPNVQGIEEQIQVLNRERKIYEEEWTKTIPITEIF